MNQACNLILKSLYQFSYKPSIQFLYALKKSGALYDQPAIKIIPEIVPQINESEKIQKVEEKQPIVNEIKQQKVVEFVEQQPVTSIYSIIQSYKTLMTEEEMDYINLCGPILGFEEKKKPTKEDNKKKKK